MRSQGGAKIQERNAPPDNIIIIVGGFVMREASSSMRKAHARRAGYEEVFDVDGPLKQIKTIKTTPKTFGDKDCEGVLYPHDDALVVTLLVAKYTRCRILIKNGSSIEVLFWDVFLKTDIEQDRLCPTPTLLKVFSRETVQPICAITVPIIAGVGS